jgi:ring-1,2-phenylacetyl-CoA epoxidase subunit PaaE
MNGRINKEKCHSFFKHLIPVEIINDFFLCGPGPMIEEVRNCLDELGVTKSNIHFEYFTPPGDKSDSHIQKSEIKGRLSGNIHSITIELDGNTFPISMDDSHHSVLEAALDAGGDLPYACKGGVCATCKARVLKGQLEMVKNYALEPDEISSGYILSCQAYPISEKSKITFDI